MIARTRSGLGGFLGFAVDLHAAIVLDVDRGLGLFADTTDGRAALADDVADLVESIFICSMVGAFSDNSARGLAMTVHLAEDVQASFGLARGRSP